MVNLQVRQRQIPALSLRNLVEPQEGQRLVRFREPMMRLYRFLTVDPYLEPSPRRDPRSEELLGIADTLFYD